MKCPTDSTELISFLNDPASPPAFDAHLAHCPLCRDRLARLHQIVLQPPDPLSCADAEPALLAWLESDASFALAPAVRQHLSSCPACQQTAVEIHALPRALAQNRLDLPSQAPEPDLTFLKAPPSPLSRWRQQLDQAVAQGAYWLVDHSGAVWLNLKLAMQWQPALSRVMVKAGQTQAQPLLQVALTPEPDLNLELVAWPDATNGDEVQVEVIVRRPSHFLDGFAGATVTLYAPGESRRAMTDSDGRVRFSGIPRRSLADIQISARG